MLFIDEVSPCKLLFKVCSYYCLVTTTVAMKAVFFCLFKMRRPSRGPRHCLCNRNGLASYDICVILSGGAPVVHDGQKYTKRQ